MSEQQRQNRRFLGAIVLIAVLSLLFGVFRLRNTLNSSLVLNSSGSSSKMRVNSAPHIADALTLQKQDTDGDGLNDYDELNRYETSPYLVDSDSDEATDAAEVRVGTDPNCPKGQECGVISAISSEKQGLELSVAGTFSENETTLPPFEAEGMRTLLVSLGALPEDQVRAMSVEELRNVYNAMSSYLAGNSTGSLDTSSGSTQFDAPDTMSADQIRGLLRQNGVEESLLRDVDDATLQRVFRETVDQYETKKNQ